MSYLISRNKVIGILEKEKSLRCSYDADIAIFSIEKGIRELPTAYDIDNIIEELKDSSKIYCEEYNQRDGNLYLLDAIEIVKQGCVDDDLCEWTQSGDMATNPHTFSKYKIKQCDGLYALSTCPHCGKKIKVVE